MQYGLSIMCYKLINNFYMSFFVTMSRTKKLIHQKISHIQGRKICALLYVLSLKRKNKKKHGLVSYSYLYLRNLFFNNNINNDY
jgi:hypothetical protein